MSRMVKGGEGKVLPPGEREWFSTLCQVRAALSQVCVRGARAPSVTQGGESGRVCLWCSGLPEAQLDLWKSG